MTVDSLGLITLTEPEPEEIYLPSYSRLLASVADAFGGKSVGILS